MASIFVVAALAVGCSFGAKITLEPDPSVDAGTTSPCTKRVGAGREFTTIQAALDATLPGDVVCVDPGTYREQLRIDRPGTPQQPVVLRGEGGRPTIDGEYTLPLGTDRPPQCPVDFNGHPAQCFRWEALVTISAAWVTVERVEVTRSKGRGVTIEDSQHIALRNCILRDTRSEGVAVLSSSDVTVENCELTGLANAYPYNHDPSVPNAPGIGAALTSHASQGLIVRANLIHENWGVGTEFDSNDGNSKTLICEDNVYFDNFWVTSVEGNGASDITMRRNLAYSTAGPGPVADNLVFLIPAEHELVDVLVEQNVFARCANAIVFVASGVSTRTIKRVNVVRNTFFALTNQSVSQPTMAYVTEASFKSNLFVETTFSVTGYPSEGNVLASTAALAGLAGDDDAGRMPAFVRGTMVNPAWFSLRVDAGVGADSATFQRAGTTD